MIIVDFSFRMCKYGNLLFKRSCFEPHRMKWLVNDTFMYFIPCFWLDIYAQSGYLSWAVPLRIAAPIYLLCRSQIRFFCWDNLFFKVWLECWLLIFEEVWKEDGRAPLKRLLELIVSKMSLKTVSTQFYGCYLLSVRIPIMKTPS